MFEFPLPVAKKKENTSVQNLWIILDLYKLCKLIWRDRHHYLQTKQTPYIPFGPLFELCLHFLVCVFLLLCSGSKCKYSDMDTSVKLNYNNCLWSSFLSWYHVTAISYFIPPSCSRMFLHSLFLYIYLFAWHLSGLARSVNLLPTMSSEPARWRQ